MILYAALLDFSAYGSYAATGGNVLASAFCGLLVCVGIGGVELAAEVLTRARLKAAGRTFTNL